MARHKKDLLAAELALGLLDGEERAAALRLQHSDHDFADAVQEWELLLAPLGEAVPPIEPDASLWHRIEASLPVAAPAEGTAAAAMLPDLAAQLEKIRRSLAMWRVGALAAAAAAVLLAIALVGNLDRSVEPAKPAARYVALLTADNSDERYLVTVDEGTHQLYVRSVGAKAPDTMAHELWVMYADNRSPETLGVIQPGPYVMLDMPKKVPMSDLRSGTRLAVSLEKDGGAPPGKAMGPVVFAGNLIRQTE